MSLITSIKQILGLSVTASENHFWDGSVANKLTLRRGTPDSPGAKVLEVDAGLLTILKSKLVPFAVGIVDSAGTLVGGYGFSSASKTSTGIYSVNFSEAVADTYYVVQVTTDAGTYGLMGTVYGPNCSTTKIEVRTYAPNNTTAVATDNQFHVVVWKV